MAVSVETLEGLERKVVITVEKEKLEKDAMQRLKDISKSVKIDGFRPGKVPFSTVKKLYESTAWREAASDAIQATLYSSLQEINLIPAGQPLVEPQQIEPWQDFIYSVKFEVFPEITIKELEGVKIEQIDATLSEDDVDQMILKLREHNKDWKETEKKAAKGDKVEIDFEGFLEGKPFEGGKAQNFSLELGSNSMIPGMEDGLIGFKKGEELDLNLTFPEAYHSAELAGKPVVFHVKINKVLKGELPEVNEEFIKKFGAKDAETFRSEIKNNMSLDLERRVEKQNRDFVFTKFKEHNPVELPKSLIEEEIKNLNHEFYHEVFNKEHSAHEKIPEFPRELFLDKAIARVHLGLLYNKYTQLHKLEASQERVDAMIDKLAAAYENPKEFIDSYKNNSERKALIENIVLENMVCEKLLTCAKIVKSTKKYFDLAEDNK